MLLHGNISNKKKYYIYDWIGGKKEKIDNKDLRNIAVGECKEGLSHLF